LLANYDSRDASCSASARACKKRRNKHICKCGAVARNQHVVEPRIHPSCTIEELLQENPDDACVTSRTTHTAHAALGAQCAFPPWLASFYHPCLPVRSCARRNFFASTASEQQQPKIMQGPTIINLRTSSNRIQSLSFPTATNLATRILW